MPAKKQTQANKAQEIENAFDVPSMDIEIQKAYLDQHHERRTHFLEWLLAHLKSGVHYMKIKRGGKNSLLKPGALYLTDLFGLRPEFTIDREAHEQAMADESGFCVHCVLIDRKTGNKVGEGRGFGVVSEHRGNYNTCIKLTEKRALLDACLHTVPCISDLFSQDLDEIPEISNGGKHVVVNKKAASEKQIKTLKWLEKHKKMTQGHKDRIGAILAKDPVPGQDASDMIGLCFDLINGKKAAVQNVIDAFGDDVSEA